MSYLNKISQNTFENFDQFFESLTAVDNIELVLDVTAQECNGKPRLQVMHNSTTLFDECLATGNHTLKFVIDEQQQNCISATMSEKNPTTDTQMVDGNIVKDKFVVVNKFVLNGFDLIEDQDFFYKHFWYRNGNVEQSVTNGFWSNATLGLDYPGSFITWYQTNTTKNVALSNDMIFKDLKSVDANMRTVLKSLEKLTR